MHVNVNKRFTKEEPLEIPVTQYISCGKFIHSSLAWYVTKTFIGPEYHESILNLSPQSHTDNWILGVRIDTLPYNKGLLEDMTARKKNNFKRATDYGITDDSRLENIA